MAPDGTVYAAFMIAASHHAFPVVEASVDHGQTFPQSAGSCRSSATTGATVTSSPSARTGVVYLTWDYGPSAKDVTFLCSKAGSCSFATGDLNIVCRRQPTAGGAGAR